ncbi:hypothetical protein UMZ34_01250 [Halopseudomonas pachastrellae]|nr:hypothetical protein UMZ34_01250 [Halopseudomonas pachastrellae]
MLTALGIRFGLEQASQFQQQRLKDDLELIAAAGRSAFPSATPCASTTSRRLSWP